MRGENIWRRKLPFGGWRPRGAMASLNGWLFGSVATVTAGLGVAQISYILQSVSVAALAKIRRLWLALQ